MGSGSAAGASRWPARWLRCRRRSLPSSPWADGSRRPPSRRSSGPRSRERLALLGTLDREGVQQLLSSSRAALILDHPTPAYLRSFPVKMFEYMAAGVPIVASDFPLWKEIIGEAGCGLLADPRDPAQIADAIQTLLSDPVAARAMGQRGREAVVERFNWVPEAAALVALYAKLVGGP